MPARKAKQVTGQKPKAQSKPGIAAKYRIPYTLLMAAVCIIVIVLLYLSGFGAITEWVGAIIILMITGDQIAKVNNLQNLFGMYMLGSRHGIAFIDSLSKNNKELWKFMADWGLVLGFGVIAYPLFRKYLGWRTFLFGLFSILVLLLIVYPYLGSTLTFLNLPQITSRLAQQSAPASPTIHGLSVLALGLYGIGMLGGFTAFTIAGIAYNGIAVLGSAVTALYNISVLHTTNNTLSQQIPGVAPLIPGITIPLFAGLISLVIILIVHEFSHGVLARLANIKIKSIGLVLFGVIPAGAYVEPNEEAVKKLSEQQQNRIFIAGVSSNILLSILFFILFLAFIYYIMPALLTTKVIIASTIPGTPAYGVIPVNTTILTWNNYQIKNISSFTVAAKNDTAGAKVSVLTSNGLYSLVANSTGKIGVYVEQVSVPRNPGIGFNIVNFLFAIVSLSFLLNFLVGVVNMLPIPGLDGWRVYKTKIKNDKIMNAITYLIILLILLNILPWLFIR